MVLTDRPKENVKELLGDSVMTDGLRNGARVIVRTADPSDPMGLMTASPNTASSIVLMSPDDLDDDNEADAMVMARVMALLALDVQAPLVVEIRDKDNLAALHEMISKVQQQQEEQEQEIAQESRPEIRESGRDEHRRTHSRQLVTPCAHDDIIGNVMVQTALQPGISKVIHHLLDYEEGQGNGENFNAFHQFRDKLYMSFLKA